MAPFFSEPVDLRLADTKYLGPADRAYAASCRPAILHLDLLRILDLDLFPALHTVCLHLYLLFLDSTRD